MLFKSIPDSTKPFQFLAIEGYLQPAMIENVIAMSGQRKKIEMVVDWSRQSKSAISNPTNKI